MIWIVYWRLKTDFLKVFWDYGIERFSFIAKENCWSWWDLDMDLDIRWWSFDFSFRINGKTPLICPQHFTFNIFFSEFQFSIRFHFNSPLTPLLKMNVILSVSLSIQLFLNYHSSLPLTPFTKTTLTTNPVIWTKWLIKNPIRSYVVIPIFLPAFLYVLIPRNPFYVVISVYSRSPNPHPPPLHCNHQVFSITFFRV